ncbi:hypothetical protein TELCIR_14781 [Teladorsagia circumcincta]|uniref:DZF domain-containing protein n=1 Tax=Teladorsagia circumcincta TaxID=45464 RepID=A0A2G9U079_TELCI|nr:hypothetical protein TELCIR_14781 [Teladorsagia circumcincta]
MRGGGYRGGPRGRAPFMPGPTFPVRPPPFDVHLANDVFVRINENNDAQLTQERFQCETYSILKENFFKDVVARATALTPTDAERTTVAALLLKVKGAIDKVMTTPDCVPGVVSLFGYDFFEKDSTSAMYASNVMEGLQRFEEYREVGSFKKDTALTGHTVADIVIIMQTLPTFVSCVSRDYGCLLAAANAQVRILITTLPSNAPNLEPDLHLAERVMMINHHALRHVAWFEEATLQSPFKDLVCSTAQTLLRVICNGGHAAVLGMDPSKIGIDLSKEVSVWNGVAVSPLEVAYVEDCMKPKFCEADEVLEQEARA